MSQFKSKYLRFRYTAISIYIEYVNIYIYLKLNINVTFFWLPVLSAKIHLKIIEPSQVILSRKRFYTELAAYKIARRADPGCASRKKLLKKYIRTDVPIRLLPVPHSRP